MDWSIVGPAVFNVTSDWGDCVGTPYLGLPTLEGADKRSAERFFIRACHDRRRRRRKGLNWKEEV